MSQLRILIMATFTVTTTADTIDASDGKLSLREAVAQANATAAADTIVFASGLEGRTLTLTQGELALRQDVTIDGDRNDDGTLVILSGNGHGRLMHVVGSGTDVAVHGLEMTGGSVEEYSAGGAILHEGRNLSLARCTFDRNSCAIGNDEYSGGPGGAIAATRAQSHLSISDSTFFGNAAAVGGAISSAGDVVARNSTFLSNVASFEGGAVDARSLTLIGCNAAGNNTDMSYGGSIFHASRVEILGSTFSNNSQYGYGYVISANDAVVTSSRFFRNHGGPISSGDLLLSNSYVAFNSGACHVSGEANIAGSMLIFNNNGIYGVGYADVNVTNSDISHNYESGIRAQTVSIFDSSIVSNLSVGVDAQEVFAENTTIVENLYSGVRAQFCTLMSSTVTANGIGIISNHAEMLNSIAAGNGQRGDPRDVEGVVSFSNGHNIFGSDAAGAILGDLQSVDPNLLFANGGLVNVDGVVPLRNAVDNPALGGGDPLAALLADQVGVIRPAPTASLPDIGAAEFNQAPSTTATQLNDVLTGSDAHDVIFGRAGADLIFGLNGKDTLRGEGGSDVLDGGLGNDTLDGGDGIDLVRYGGAIAVSVDLAVGTARRGSELDTLSSIQGAIGSSASDRFQGDGNSNWFQGGGGKDTATGGGGRDLYDFNAVADSKAGASTRDVITDFAHLSDKIDVTGLDADTTVAGNQAFHWVGTAALTGPGEIGYFTTGGNTIIRASTDGDAASEFEIQLTGIKALSVADFYL